MYLIIQSDQRVNEKSIPELFDMMNKLENIPDKFQIFPIQNRKGAINKVANIIKHKRFAYAFKLVSFNSPS